jgi:putative acetyltransferase
LVGCGAIKRLSLEHAELKSMRVASSLRRSGVASQLLRYIVDQSRKQGYQRLSLETGSMPFFQPARTLYAKHGFTPCSPFNGYTEDPNSVFMTLEL